MIMKIKNWLRELGSDSLTEYYRKRLEHAESNVEIEAIIYTQGLLDWMDYIRKRKRKRLKINRKVALYNSLELYSLPLNRRSYCLLFFV